MRSPFLSTLLAIGLAVALSPAVLAADAPTQGLRYPSLSPDGKTVAFAYRGDIWSAPTAADGPARRLTLHEAQETLCRVSPDGKWIAFSSLRNGSYDLFVVPVTGGLPKQLTFHSASEILCDWSPDSKRLLFSSQRALGPYGLDLFEVDIDGGTPRRITFDGGRDGAYSPDGKKVVYIRGFVDIYWDDYEGSSNFDIHTIDVTGGTPLQVTDTDGNERWPFYSADGKSIYYVGEEKGVANFWSIPAEGGKAKRLTEYAGYDVQRPYLAANRKSVVFERGGRLFTANLEDPAKNPTAIPLDIRSDVRHSGTVRRTITGGGEQVDVSRDGSQVAFTLRGDIWVMPAGGGQGRRITSGPANEQWPRFSPDGSRIAYFSSATGNSDIFVVELGSGKTTQATRHPANDFYHSWAPDGERIVFSSERSGNRDIWIADLVSGEETQLTTSNAPDDDPSFSRDGELIAFDSGRDGSQAIWVMNADGSGQRRVTSGSGFFQVPSFSPDGRMIVYEAFRPTGGSGGLFVTYTAGGESARISADGASSCWSADDQWIYFHANRGPGANGIHRVRAPERVETGELVPFYGEVEVEIREELGNLFDEAWNALREGFYDPKMHGLDWNAMREKYRAMAIDTENKAEFQNVIRQLLAELGASHLGIGGGARGNTGVTPDVEENGILGLDFEYAPTDGGGRRIERILPGGPADKAGLRVGDVVTRIGRTKLTKDTNLDRLTKGTVGKELPVGFRPLSEAGLGDERMVTVTPTNLRGVAALNYQNWVKACTERVRDKTRGTGIGYIHLSQMNGQNLAKFQQAVSRWNSNDRVKGMILDVRNNGGGNIHGQLIQILTARPLAMVQRRGGPKTPQPSLYWDRPVVVLTNERSFSDAEVFPWMFRAAGIGKIVGVPTAGGVIGTNNITLSDGSTFRIPTVGFWGMDGTPLEGHGVKPDILVEETPEDRLKGRDPQLVKAIEVVLEEVKAKAEAEKKPAKPDKPAPKKPVEPKKPVKPLPDDPQARADLRHPLRDARTGEWVQYRTTKEMGVESRFRVTVSGVADGAVTFTSVIEEGGDPMLPLPEKAPADADLISWVGEMGKVLGHRVVEGKLGEEDVNLLLVDVQWPDGSQLTLSFTDILPVYGLVRVTMGKVLLMEASEWGEAPKPEPAAEEGKAPRHPVFDARVGEWVLVKRAQQGRKIDMKMTVTEVTGTEVVLKPTVTLNGREVQGPEIRRPRDEFLVPPQAFTLAGYDRETVLVNGRELACVVMTATAEDGSEWKWWVSDEVPVNGYVRVTRNGGALSELLDWGFASDG